MTFADFDMIWCINLERRVDRRDRFLKHITDIGIEDYVKMFNAIDKTNESNGSLGCLLSHYEIYRLSLSAGYKNVLILEDDVEFALDVCDRFAEWSKEIPSDWEMIYFGGNHNSLEKDFVSEHVHRLKKTYTTHCYAITNHAMSVIRDYIDSCTAEPIDVILAKFQSDNGKSYGIYPHLAWQISDYSDIEGVNVNYNFLK